MPNGMYGGVRGEKFIKNYPLLDLSKTQISKIISDLKKKGWISVKYVNKENTKAVDKRIIKINRPPYPTRVKEGIKAEDNTPIKPQFKDNNKYINNKNSYMNYEQRDYSNFDWESLYANNPENMKKFYDNF